MPDFNISQYFAALFCQKLGFASCKRNSGATEGINVLLEKLTLEGKWTYGLSCIEYTEFDKFGITVGPSALSKYSFLPYTFSTYICAYWFPCNNFMILMLS